MRPLSSPPCDSTVLALCAALLLAALRRQRQAPALHRLHARRRPAPRCQKVAAPAPKGEQHLSKPTTTLAAGKRYDVDLQTNCGTITIRLATGRAPKTSASFADLVKRGFYDGLTFHRIVHDFVIQGGDPLGTGLGGPGYTVVEKPPGDLAYTTGVVAMAKTEADPPGASGSQFFIVTAPDARAAARLRGRRGAWCAAWTSRSASAGWPGRRPGAPDLAGRHREGDRSEQGEPRHGGLEAVGLVVARVVDRVAHGAHAGLLERHAELEQRRRLGGAVSHASSASRGSMTGMRSCTCASCSRPRW